MPCVAPVLLLLMGAISNPRHLGYRARRDPCANLNLFVALNGRLLRSATLFAPHNRDLCAGLAVLNIHDRQGDHRAFIVGVASIRGQPDSFTAAQYLVVGQGSVVCEW